MAWIPAYAGMTYMAELTEAQGKAMDLGYRIGQKREESGLSIDEVATAIHLRRAHIRAIEAGDFTQLPGEAYARGYIKRYVEFLELDSEQILEEFSQATTPGPRKLLGIPEIFSHETHASGMLALAGIALAMMCVILWNALHSVDPVSLVMPFEELDTSVVQVLPHRCSANQSSYPPCSWENIGLWYRPTKPDYHLFATYHEPTP